MIINIFRLETIMERRPRSMDTFISPLSIDVITIAATILSTF